MIYEKGGIYYEFKKNSTVNIEYKEYCIYCCEPAKRDSEWDEYTPTYSYYCDCELAELERQMNKEIREVKGKYERKLIKNKKGLRELEYSIKLKELKREYKL